MEQIYKRLNEIFKGFFDDDSIEIDENTTAEDIEDWDSLNHITLIDTVESEFGRGIRYEKRGRDGGNN